MGALNDARIDRRRIARTLGRLAGLVPLLLLAAAPGPPARAAERTPRGSAASVKANFMIAPPLSADLVSAIANPALEMLLVRLIDLGPGTAEADGLAVRTGPARFEVLDVIHGRSFQRGQTLVVPVSQIADPPVRVRNQINKWNGVPLQPGSAMLLACAPVPPGSPCIAQAGIAVDGTQGGEVEAVRRCYAIEEQRTLPEPERWNRLSPLLAAALQSPQPLLFQYALDFLGRRMVLGRDAGANLLARAVAHPATGAEQRFEIGSALSGRSPLFDPARGADRANIDVVTALASGLVAETVPRQQLQWMRFTAAVLLAELSPDPARAAALRRQLAHGVSQPPAERVRQALQAVHAGATGPDQERAAALAEVWR